MADLILGPMLRHVTSTSATVWVETDGPCSVEVLGHVTHTFCVAKHHYALVIVDGLQPDSTTRYQVALDGEQRWPLAGSNLPASVIRTLHDGMTPRIIFGSCRTAAPHTAPWSLEMSIDKKGRGVDALYAYALRMVEQDPSEWPDLAIFLGDQVYADDSSPKTRARIAARRDRSTHPTLPPKLVHGFTEFCWLYQESWSPEIERWFLSVVPTAMIFDDHDMIDDWNISAAWVEDIHRQEWWMEHVVGGLMAYWLYQHLGNLSPTDIRDEGLLDALMTVEDGEQVLRDWARGTEEFTAGRDRYRFSFARDLGRVRLVMIDARNGRDLTPGKRSIVDTAEWEWIVGTCHADVDHLLIGSSLPVFVPGGLHDLEVWASALCDGAWGRLGARFGEWMRRALDLEDWSAFVRSFDDLVKLLGQLVSDKAAITPSTICLLSGDIHLSYTSQVTLPHGSSATTRIYQLVNSPMRNALPSYERVAMHVVMSRMAAGVTRLLRRLVGLHRTAARWKLDEGPVFENCVGRLDFEGRAGVMLLEQAKPYDDQGDPELEEVFTLRLDPRPEPAGNYAFSTLM